MRRGHECGEVCKNAYVIEGKAAPCETCFPEILPRNQTAWENYLRVQGQVITAGMDGVIIDMHYPAVLEMFRLYGVADERDCFERVIVIFREVQALRNAK